MPHKHAVHQHGDKHDIPDEHRVHKTGAWRPADHRVHKQWMKKTVEHVDDHPKELIPVLKEFQELIEGDSAIYKHVNAMYEEVPNKKPYKNDPTGNKQVRDYKHLLQILNHLLTTAPTWTDAAAHVGMVGVPINAVFDWPMGTASGHAFFLDSKVNAMLKKVLNVWGEFLKSPESAKCLGTDKNGWFGETGIADLSAVANGPRDTSLKFEEMYKCDPSAEYHGFKSWDDFFTRPFQESWRPVEEPDNDDIINNACESKTYRTSHNVKLRDRFWIKGQPYSVMDMLDHDPLAEQFTGGTIYQAFLSALSYHRWHSPVSGTIKKCWVADGTYFSEPLFEGLGDASTSQIDVKGITDAQGYITALAARAIIFIEADNPKIGLMAFIGVGMDEVSTCDITVKEGQHVKKGEQTGMFHFGGSSHCLLFRKGVKVGGFPQPGQEHNVPVRSALAAVKE